jgi:hypothetical protein
VIYINRSVTECIEAASTAATCARPEANRGVCDLNADGRTLVLLLSAITVRVCGLPVSVVLLARLARGYEPCMRLICQSAAMFAVKLCDMIGLKEQWAEHQRLVAEHAALIAELEATLSPEQAVHVESIIEKHGKKRSSSLWLAPPSIESGDTGDVARRTHS